MAYLTLRPIYPHLGLLFLVLAAPPPPQPPRAPASLRRLHPAAPPGSAPPQAAPRRRPRWFPAGPGAFSFWSSQPRRARRRGASNSNPRPRRRRRRRRRRTIRRLPPLCSPRPEVRPPPSPNPGCGGSAGCFRLTRVSQIRVAVPVETLDGLVGGACCFAFGAGISSGGVCCSGNFGRLLRCSVYIWFRSGCLIGSRLNAPWRILDEFLNWPSCWL